MATDVGENSNVMSSATIPPSVTSCSEVPGAVPLSDIQVDIPQSSNSETNNEGPSAANQSLFIRVQGLRKNCTGCVNFLSQAIALLIGTVCFLSCVFALVFAIPVAMIVVGTYYFDECTVQPLIPIYLTVGGSFSVFSSLTWYYNKLRENPSVLEILICHKFPGLVNTFLFIWFIIGCVWTYKEYEPEYEDTSSSLYCNRTLYLFTFWVLTSSFIVWGIIIVCCVCSLFMAS